MDTRASWAMATPLRDPRLVKNTGPRESRPLSSTIRALGAPSGSTVATTIAFGSVIPAATTSASQRCELVHRVRDEVGLGQARVGVRAPQRGHVHHGPGPSGATFVTPGILSQSGAAGCEG